MQNYRLLVLAASVCSTWAISAVAQIVDPGFENPITTDGPPFVGSWEGFNGTSATAGNSSLLPRTGSQSLTLTITSQVNSYAGAFQDIPGLLPGGEYSLGGWHVTTSKPFDVGVEVRIEWRNSILDNEVSRTPNLTPIPSDLYSQFSLIGTVPAGADTARLVYAIQSFGSEPSHTGTVFVDDISFEAVPEVSSLIPLSGVGLAFMVLRRRRS